MKIPFHKPYITEDEISGVVEVLRSGWLTTGPRTKEFESAFADFVGAGHAVALNSGTAALHLALEAIGLKEGEEVITTTMTFAATAEVVRYFGARPVLVDIDTGWGGAFNIARTVSSMIRSGAAAVHIEDQVQAKRCGHRPGKAIVSESEMVDRVKAAVDAKTDSDFVIMARTDALAVEGLQAAIDRASACVEAGADMIFPEAMTELSMYREFAKALKEVPVLANITEFGATPLYTTEELRGADVSLVLYPLSAFRAMSRAALDVYTAIRKEGTQKNVVDIMQPRAELYEYLDYHAFEQYLDNIFSKEETK